MTKKTRMRGAAIGAAFALAGAIALAAQPAAAFSYATDDLLLMISKSGTEATVNLGQLGSGTSPLSASIDLTSFGGSLSGATYRLLAEPVRASDAPNSQNEMVFSAAPGVNVPSYASSDTLVNGLAAVSFLFDDSPNGYAPALGLVGPGTANILSNTATQITYPESNGISYKAKLNATGGDTLNSNFPFGIGTLFDTSSSTTLWDAQINQDFTGSILKELGTVTLSGSTATFSPVPEPGTLLLLGAGLSGLVVFGRRKNG